MIIKPVDNPEHFRKNIVKYIDGFIKNDTYSTNIEKVYIIIPFLNQKRKNCKKMGKCSFCSYLS